MKRPIVVYADENSIDSSRGQIIDPFKMILPRLSKYGDQEVFVTPFTTLLTELIIEAKREVLQEELPIEKGCADEGWALDTEIESRVDEFDQRFNNLYGFTISDLVQDFVGTTEGKITEERAGELVDIFLKQVLPLEQNLTNEVTNSFNQFLPVTMYLNEEARTKIFDDGNLNDIEFNFHGSFIDPIDSNLEKRFSFYATEVTLNDQNQLTRYYCSPDSISSCVYDEFSLNGVKRSARNYNFKQTLVDESVDLSALPTPFANTDYEFGIGVEDFGFWDYDPNRPDQEYQLFCQDRKRFQLISQDADDLSGNPARKQISLLVQKDTRDVNNESCYPVRDWFSELIEYQTYNMFGLTEGDGTSVAITEPPYSRGLPQFFDCCGNSVLGFSVLDYFANPDQFDNQDIINDLLSLDYSFGNYPFFARRGLGTSYTFITRDSNTRLQWTFNSNNANYRWLNEFSHSILPLEGGQGEEQYRYYSAQAREEFFNKLGEYNLDELKGDQGIPNYTEISSIIVQTSKSNGLDVRHTPLYLNLTRQQNNLGDKYIGDATQASILHKIDKDEIIGKLQVNGITAENDFKLLVKHNGAFNPYLTNKDINIEVKLTQFKEGSNPGVRTEDESRITMSLPMLMNSTNEGINFSPNGSANITFEYLDTSVTENLELNEDFTLKALDSDIYTGYLNLLIRFYALLDQSSKQNLESHFDSKSYLSVSLNNNFLNSSFPLWRSFDVFEGPIEYFSNSGESPTTDFQDLIYFEKDVLEIQANSAGSICVILTGKQATTVTANLVIRGPEHFDYNSEVPINTSDLVVSAPIVTWGTDTGPKCITIEKSNSYDDSEYDKMEAYYYLEIVPENGGNVYRGDKLLIQVNDDIR